MPGKQRRGRVQLEVEAIELDGDAWIRGRGAHHLVARQWPRRAINQGQFELGTDRGRAYPEARPFEQIAEYQQALL